MLRNLVTSLFKNGSITTTVTRAKETQKLAEKMITLAKRGQLASNRMVSSYFYEDEVARQLVEELAPKYETRNGGYTQILKLGPRRGDGSPMVILKLI